MALFTRTKKEEFVPITTEEVDQVMGEMMQQRQRQSLAVVKEIRERQLLRRISRLASSMTD